MELSAAKRRCDWVRPDSEIYRRYHDLEWGVATRSDRKLFEFLILEGAQAGLSWLTILKKREGYRRAFDGFDPELIAKYGRREKRALLADESIVRNRLKIDSAIINARVFLSIKDEFGLFSDYLWGHVDFRPIRNRPRSSADTPTRTPLSDKISADLKRRGMKFVGSTIIYAYLQAVGLIDDHQADCFRSQEG